LEKAIIDLEKKEATQSKTNKNSSNVDDEKLQEFLKEFEKCKKILKKFLTFLTLKISK